MIDACDGSGSIEILIFGSRSYGFKNSELKVILNIKGHLFQVMDRIRLQRVLTVSEFLLIHAA